MTIELTTPAGARLDVLTLGAAVDAWVPASGDGRSVVVSWPIERRRAQAQPFAGAVVGRYANRIAGGRFVLGGVEHVLDVNEPPNTLHGGAGGFDRRDWTPVERAADRVTLSLHSPDGDQGFPGALDATVTYVLHDDAVEVELTATADAPTVVSLASHPYLDLGPSPVLTVPAARYLPTDATGVPLPGSTSVAGTPYDLRSGVEAGPDSGLDHAFLVDGAGLRVVATLVAGGRKVVVESDQPSVQVYTGGPAGVAVEAQREPDGPHRDLDGVTLRPGETYRSRTRWTYADASDR